MYMVLRSTRRGDLIHERVFMGPDSEPLALTGTLVMDIGQWQEFGAALMLGAQQMHGNLVVTSPDGRGVVDPTDSPPVTDIPR